MKKMITLFLATVMLFSLCLPCLADEAYDPDTDPLLIGVA